MSDRDRIGKHTFWPLLWYFEKRRIWKRSSAKVRTAQPLSGPSPAQIGQAKSIAKRERLGRERRFGQWKLKLRPIAYASHRDSAVFSYYSYLIQQHYETYLSNAGLTDAVLAYRRIPRTIGDGGKSNYDFAAEAFAEIAERGACEAACLDLKSFFDSLPHGEIKRQWKRLCGFDELPPDHYAVYRATTRYARVSVDQLRKSLGISVRKYKKMKEKCIPFPVDRGAFQRQIRERGLIEVNAGTGKRGIPQGLPISGLLANVTMLEIDQRMSRLAAVCGGSYRRYSDDVLIVTPPGNARRLAAVMSRLVSKAGMMIQREKSTFHVFRRDRWSALHTTKPLQYLGFEFDGNRVTIRQQTLARFGKRMRKAVRTAGRVAARRWDGVGTVRIRRRQLYNLYSPLPYLWAASDHKKSCGSFTDYARRAKASVRIVMADTFRAQMLTQLRRKMQQLDKLITTVEAEQTLLQQRIRAARNRKTGTSTLRPGVRRKRS